MQVASRVHTAVTTTQRAMLRVMRGVAAAAVLGVKVKEVCFLCLYLKFFVMQLIIF